MRQDEQFASSCVLSFLGGEATVVDGEDPPDCYFEFEGDRYAAEISQLRPVSYDRHGNPKNRTTEDTFSMRFSDKLDADLKHGLPPKMCLCLDIQGPIRAPRKFKRELRNIVVSIIDEGLTVEGWRKSYEIADNLVSIASFTRDSQTGRQIVSIVSNDDAQPWIQGDARVILADRITEKENIMSGVSSNDPRWLILLNAHPMATVTEYQAAYKQLSITHGFERVFLIEENGSVAELSRKA